MAKSHKPEPAELGKMLVNIYETGYLDKNQAYKQSFIKGAIAGFGGVLGATILVALLLWVLSLFHRVPFVEDISKTIKQSSQTQQESE